MNLSLDEFKQWKKTGREEREGNRGKEERDKVKFVKKWVRTIHIILSVLCNTTYIGIREEPKTTINPT